MFTMPHVLAFPTSSQNQFTPLLLWNGYACLHMSWCLSYHSQLQIPLRILLCSPSLRYCCFLNVMQHCLLLYFSAGLKVEGNEHPDSIVLFAPIQLLCTSMFMQAETVRLDESWYPCQWDQGQKGRWCIAVGDAVSCSYIETPNASEDNIWRAVITLLLDMYSVQQKVRL